MGNLKTIEGESVRINAFFSGKRIGQARTVARIRGVSLSAALREALDMWLRAEAPKAKAIYLARKAEDTGSSAAMSDYAQADHLREAREPE